MLYSLLSRNCKLDKMLTLVKKIQKIWDYGEARTALAAICAHSVSISIGICQGYSAILLPQLMTSPHIHIDSEQASWIASLGAVSNPIGSILSGVLGEVLGRRRSMQISSLPFIIGWITIALAINIQWLYAGRFITGIAAGMSTACYTYVTEISTPENRGILQALGPISASLGILLTYCLGYILSWEILAYGSVLFGIITVIGVQIVPESPSWIPMCNWMNM
ncbi:pippin [Carabus blaptoides fortunei]